MDNSKIIKGSLSVIILQLLNNNGRMYGYEIAKAVEASTRSALLLTEAALYQALHKLEAEELLDSKSLLIENRVRKYYKLTGKGKKEAGIRVAALKESMTTLQQVLRYRLPGRQAGGKR